jgi:hypothetical protein
MSESIGKALIRTVAGSPLADSIFEAAEAAVDSGITDDLVKEIPIFGTLANIARTGDAVRTHLFGKKLLRFIRECSTITDEERTAFLEKYSTQPESEVELGENLLLVLEKLDHMKKAEVLARFFLAFVRGQIDLLTFSRLMQALERFNLELLPALSYMYHPQIPALQLTEDIRHELSLAGLMTVNLSGSGSIGGGALYTYSPIARLFLKLGFGVEETK